MPYTYISIYIYIYIYKYVCVRVSVWNTTLFQNIYVHQCAFWLSICRCGDENRIHQDHLKREGKPLNGVSSRNIPWVKKLVKSYILFCCHHSMEGWRGDRSIYAMHLAAQLEFQVPLRPKCSEWFPACWGSCEKGSSWRGVCRTSHQSDQFGSLPYHLGLQHPKGTTCNPKTLQAQAILGVHDQARAWVLLQAELDSGDLTIEAQP